MVIISGIVLSCAIASGPVAVHAPADTANGNAPPRKPPVHDGEEMKRRAALARDVSANFGQLVSLLMRSRAHRFHMLADLEYMIVPAIATRQFRVAEGVSAEAGLVAPVAAVMWASVSAEVDQRLTEAVDQPIRLKPEEWRSGEVVWIVDAVGDPKAINALLQHLKQNELQEAREDADPGHGRQACRRARRVAAGSRRRQRLMGGLQRPTL